MFDSSHPREKPCGGGVTGRALGARGGRDERCGWLATIAIRSGALHRRAERFDGAVTPKTRRRRGCPAGQRKHSSFPSRASFDAALVNAASRRRRRSRAGAGVGCRDRRRSRDDHDPPGARRADFVIGADGPNSLVRRRLARRFGRDQLSIATGFFAHGVTSDQIAIELITDPPGYIWSFPRPPHLAIGICAQADSGITAGALRRQTAAWIESDGDRRGSDPASVLVADPFAECLLISTHSSSRGRAGASPATPPASSDPITREGIYFALSSGSGPRESFVVNRTRATCASTRACTTRLFPSSPAPRGSRPASSDPAFTGLVMRALHESEAIRAVMADLIAGRQSSRR